MFEMNNIYFAFSDYMYVCMSHALSVSFHLKQSSPAMLSPLFKPKSMEACKYNPSCWKSDI